MHISGAEWSDLSARPRDPKDCPAFLWSICVPYNAFRSALLLIVSL